MTPKEVIKWLQACSQDGPHNCAECPYNKDPYELGCGKLLSDAALLLQAAYVPQESQTLDMMAIMKKEVFER